MCTVLLPPGDNPTAVNKYRVTQKTGNFEMRSDSHVQLAALRNMDLSYRQPRHSVIMDQRNGKQRAFAIKMFYKNNDTSKVPDFLCNSVYHKTCVCRVVGQLKIVMECKDAFCIKHMCTVHNKQPGTVIVLECVRELIVGVTVTKARDLVGREKSVVLLKNPSTVRVSGTCTRSYVMEKQGCARQ
jgi:hypothetical protein